MDIASDTQMPRRAILAVFLVLAGLTVALGVAAPDADTMLHSLPNDSAMRLVSVRDLLGGQGWFDLTQYRLGLEGGFEMHWSRLVDAPLAALVLAGDLVTDRAGAERLALILWPLALMFAVVIVSWRITRELGGDLAGLVAAVIAWFSMSLNGRFHPGALDHHNLQVLLLLIVVHGTLALRTGPAASAGIALAASLAVGVETLPILVFCAGVFGLRWVAQGVDLRGATVAFGGALTVALAAIFAATVPASAWSGGYCDALSRDLALPVIVGASLLSGAAFLLSNTGRAARTAGLIGVAAAAGSVAVLLAPACLSNPYDDLAPELHRLWLDRVIEAQSIADIFRGVLKPVFLAWYAPGLLAVAAAFYFAMTRSRRDWWIVTGLLALALAIALYQVRGATVLLMLAVAPLGSLTADLIGRWQRNGSRLALLAAVFPILLSAPHSWAFVVSGGVELTSRIAGTAQAEGVGPKPPVSAKCFAPGVFGPLANEPAGVVASGTDIGTQILLHTPYRVLSAPYHRNEAGMLAAFDIATAQSDTEARAIVDRLGVTHIVTCATMPETRALKKLGYDGFFAALEAGQVPGWLTELTLPEPESALRLFRVERPGGA